MSYRPFGLLALKRARSSTFTRSVPERSSPNARCSARQATSPNHRRGRRITAAAGVVLLAATAFGTTPVEAAATTQRLAVPAYFWPGAQWDRLAGAGPSVKLVVANPDSGPGTQRIQVYADAIARSRAAGQKVVGYVDTAYGAKTAARVQSDIDQFYSWYGIDGIFFDQTSNDCGKAPYYQSLADAVRRRGGITVLNPGTNTPPCYASAGDVIVNFEGTPSMYATWSPEPWVNQYPAEKFWHLIYGASSSSIPDLVATSKNRHAGLIYITPDTLPNPWDQLPNASDWARLTDSSGAREVPAPVTTQAPVATPPPAPPPTEPPVTAAPPTTPPQTAPPEPTPPPTRQNAIRRRTLAHWT